MYDSPEVKEEHLFRSSFAATGLSTGKARYYNPAIGRFISEDPARIAMENAFVYVTNSPGMFTDPSGYYRAGQIICRRRPHGPDPSWGGADVAVVMSDSNGAGSRALNGNVILATFGLDLHNANDACGRVFIVRAGSGDDPYKSYTQGRPSGYTVITDPDSTITQTIVHRITGWGSTCYNNREPGHRCSDFSWYLHTGDKKDKSPSDFCNSN